jgi:3-phenylpropionate/cinnamic acid dioxygenase small subunit
MAGHQDDIRALVYAYAERLDAGDLEGVARLFADATYGVAGGPICRGAAGVLAALGVVRLHGGLPRTKHVISNLVVEVDDSGTGAAARSYFTVLQATAALPLQPVVAGRYQDRFERADAWRFAERIIHIDLVGNTGEHLDIPLRPSPG